MKKIHWLRRLSFLVTMFGVGAVATGEIPTWIKIILCCGVGGYLLLMAEFDYEKKRTSPGATEKVQK